MGHLHAVIVLDISDPATPREVFRLPTPETFYPHWLARDPLSNRLVLGAEVGGEEGFYLLRFDAQAGRLSFDPALKGDGPTGYLDLKKSVLAARTERSSMGTRRAVLAEVGGLTGVR